MRLVEYRLARPYRSVLDRVDVVLDQAAQMIAQRERQGLGAVEVAVTTAEGMADLICAAHERLVGASDWDAWFDRRRAGFATLDRASSSVVINAEVLRGDRVEIDKTILHELTHAAQFNRPGYRDIVRRGIAFDYGVGWMTKSQSHALDRHIKRDEREAEQAERLHRQLATAAG